MTVRLISVIISRLAFVRYTRVTSSITCLPRHRLHQQTLLDRHWWATILIEKSRRRRWTNGARGGGGVMAYWASSKMYVTSIKQYVRQSTVLMNHLIVTYTYCVTYTSPNIAFFYFLYIRLFIYPGLSNVLHILRTLLMILTKYIDIHYDNNIKYSTNKTCVYNQNLLLFVMYVCMCLNKLALSFVTIIDCIITAVGLYIIIVANPAYSWYLIPYIWWIENDQVKVT